MGENNYSGLSVLGALFAGLAAVKMKSGSGSFNDDDEDGIVEIVPMQNNNQDNQQAAIMRRMQADLAVANEMNERAQFDPFLGQYVDDHVRRTMSPEYKIQFDLIDETGIPIPEEMITTPERPWGPKDLGRMRREYRPNMSSILRSESMGMCHGKPAFFMGVAAIKPLIEKDAVIIDVDPVEPDGFEGGVIIQQNNFGIMRGNHYAVGPNLNPNQGRYRINLVGHPSQHGRVLSGMEVVPFSPLFYTFEIYGDKRWAMDCFNMAMDKLNELFARQGIGMNQRRNLGGPVGRRPNQPSSSPRLLPNAKPSPRSRSLGRGGFRRR